MLVLLFVWPSGCACCMRRRRTHAVGRTGCVGLPDELVCCGFRCVKGVLGLIGSAEGCVAVLTIDMAVLVKSLHLI